MTYSELFRFPEIKEAADYTAVLDEHNIPYTIEDASMRFEVVSMDSPWARQYVLKVRTEDLEKAQELFSNASQQAMNEGVSETPRTDHREQLKEMNDEELRDVLVNRKEWSVEFVNAARLLAKERNLTIPDPPAFPPKAVEEKEEYAALKSIRSMLVFILIYYAAFSNDLLSVLVLVAVIFFHEAGHFIAMRAFNFKDVKMFFIPLMGAYVSGNKSETTQSQRAIITLAGPVPGIILGCAMYMLGYHEESKYAREAVNLLIFLNAFNLLPVIPLDGGRLVETLFFASRKILQRVFIILSIIMMVAVAIYFEFWTLLILAVFMLLLMYGQRSKAMLRKKVAEAGLNPDKQFEDMSDEEYFRIRKIVIAQSQLYKDVPPDNYSTSKESSIISSIAGLAEVHIKKNLSLVGKLGFLLLWLVFLLLPVVIIL